MKVGLIGLGGIGRGLAKSMATKGVGITVSDLDQTRVNDAVVLGAKTGGSVQRMAVEYQVLMICVTTVEVVQSIAFTPHLPLDNAHKDIRYYAEMLAQAGMPASMAQSFFDTYARAANMGHGGEGCTAVIKGFEDATGVVAELAK